MIQLLHFITKLSVFVFLISSMLGTGMGLTLGLLIAPLRQWRLVLLALGLNFVFAPFLAWLVTLVIPLQSGHAIGLLLLSGAAGAPFVPKLVETARGNLTLAAALMVLLTVGTIIFMPLALPLFISGLEASARSIARPLVFFILLPLILGLLVRTFAESFANRVAPTLAKVSTASLVIVFVLLVVLHIPALIKVVGSKAILAGIVYLVALFAGSWILSAREADARDVLLLATGARNFGAALVPAASSFNDPSISVALIVNAILGVALSFLAAAWL